MAEKRNMPTLIERPDGRGALLSGGVPGNKGGPGRPPSKIRERFRGILHLGQEELERRLQKALAGITPPPREELEKMSKEELIELILDPPREMGDNELARLLDLCAKYGIGMKHVHSGEDDGPIKHGIVLLPPTDDP